MKGKEAVFTLLGVVCLILLLMFVTGDVEYVALKVGKALVGVILLRVTLAYLDRINGKRFTEVTRDWSSEDWSRYFSFRFLSLAIFCGIVFL